MQNTEINEEYSKKLLKIVNRSIKHKLLWNNLFLSINEDLTVSALQGLIEEFRDGGFIEMYFFCIVKLAEAAGVYKYDMDSRFIDFLIACLPPHIVLDKSEVITAAGTH